MKINIPSRLSDDELIAEVKRLAHCERGATVDLIIHLAELDKRRLYLAAGFSSLFTYCAQVLRLSEHAAYHRIVAARAARRFPILLRMLGQGSLNLTSIRLLAPHLAEANHEELLAAASGKSKREVEDMLARRFPQPDVASTIRKLPAARPRPDLPPALAPAGAAVACATPGTADEPPAAAPRSASLASPVGCGAPATVQIPPCRDPARAGPLPDHLHGDR